MVGGVAIALGIIVAAFTFESTPQRSLDQTEMRLVKEGNAIRTVKGDGSRHIHVFVSVDCRFCHKAEAELDKLDNVTVHRYLLPGRDETSIKAAEQVMCAVSPVQAWKAIAAGEPQHAAINAGQCNRALLDENKTVAVALGLRSTPSIIFPNGRLSPGLMSASEMEKGLL